MENLTQKEQDTLLKIHQFKASYGYMPTQRELAAALYLSYCAIRNRIANLVKKGYLVSGKSYESRTIKFAKSIEFNSNQIPVLGVIN